MMPAEYITYLNKKKVILFNMLFLINILSPYTTWAYIIQIVSLFLLITFFKEDSIVVDSKNIFIIISILISFSFSFFWSNISTENYFRFLNLLLLFLFFPITKYYPIKTKILLFVLIIILASQLVYFLNVSNAINIIDYIFPPDPLQNAVGNGAFNVLSAKYSFRTGGIYHNGNNCGQILNLILVGFIIQNKGKKLLSTLLFYIILICAIIMTGSRSAAIISVAIIGYYYLIINKKSSNFILLFIVLLSLISIAITFNLRIFNLVSDIQKNHEGSLVAKFSVLKYYLNNTESYTFILG